MNRPTVDFRLAFLYLLEFISFEGNKYKVNAGPHPNASIWVGITLQEVPGCLPKFYKILKERLRHETF
jgi:hypothetical protein